MSYPDKRLGQHFLKNPVVIENLVAFIKPNTHNHMVEIGPGLGALTKQLRSKVARLDVIEFDRQLAKYLQDSHSTSLTIRVHYEDALQFDLNGILDNSTSKIRLVGNLPYNIATALLFHYLEQLHCIADMHFMFQKEVVDRICAKPGERCYSRLTVMVQYSCQTDWLCDIPPDAFQPPPRVMSSFVRLQPRASNPYGVVDQRALAYIVKRAFSQRRKMIRNNLAGLFSPEQLGALHIAPDLRPQQITIAQFVRLAQRCDIDFT